jgi:hypothetical protein
MNSTNTPGIRYEIQEEMVCEYSVTNVSAKVTALDFNWSSKVLKGGLVPHHYNKLNTNKCKHTMISCITYPVRAKRVHTIAVFASYNARCGDNAF